MDKMSNSDFYEDRCDEMEFERENVDRQIENEKRKEEEISESEEDETEEQHQERELRREKWIERRILEGMKGEKFVNFEL